MKQSKGVKLREYGGCSTITKPEMLYAKTHYHGAKYYVLSTNDLPVNAPKLESKMLG
jgi:hypothetical protein